MKAGGRHNVQMRDGWMWVNMQHTVTGDHRLISHEHLLADVSSGSPGTVYTLPP